MKLVKILRILSITIILSFGILFVKTVNAEVSDTTSSDTSTGSTGVQTIAPTTGEMPKPPINTSAKPPLGQKIKAQVEDRIELNKDIRNADLEKRQAIRQDIKAKTQENLEKRKENIENRKEIRGEMKEAIKERLDGIRLIQATSTGMFKKIIGEKKEELKKMKTEAFQIRKEALIKELNIAVNNLLNIASRIESRITKLESEGKILTDARNLLTSAKAKIDTAKINVEALNNMVMPTPRDTNTATSTEIDLSKPRQLGDIAIKSVKEAKDSLMKVVASIEKIVKATMNATTTSPTPGSN
jgi:exonuclease VII small subunit